jgi:hypothetical protein
VFTTLLLAAASSAFALRKGFQNQFVVASRIGSALAPDAEPALGRATTQVSSLKSVLQGRAGARPTLRAQPRLKQERRSAVHRFVRSGSAGQAFSQAGSIHSCAWPQSGQYQDARSSRQHQPDTARPNPSLNRTRYGKRRKPVPRHLVHHRSTGLRRLPPQAG